ncbi:MAG TPA: DUF4249 family protein, partial [Puia sp.]|nr:DUF4249 family protein [Puia sp.]
MKKGNSPLILLLLVAMAAGIAACKKVISVDLNNAAPQIVIEGEITNARGPYQVKISKTVNFSASNVYPPVTNATVTITDSTSGISEQLIGSDSGIYKTRNIVGAARHTYALNVMVDGKQYSAVSTMPVQVLLDSVTFALNFDV